MGEKMTLTAVRDALLEEKAIGWPMAAHKLQKWADALTAHLTQPAQAVDAVSTELRTMRGEFAKQLKRAERAESLLRDIDRNGVLSLRVREAITAHLSENSRG